MHNDALFPDTDLVQQDVRAKIAARDAETVELGDGPVLTGVQAMIGVLTATGKGNRKRIRKVDPDEQAGLLALARSTARSVDRMTGHNPTGWHANGRDLAPLVEQLREILTTLTGTDDTDPLAAWLADESAPVEQLA